MYVVQKQAAQFPLRCLVFGLCLVGVALLVLLGCCLFCLPLFFVSAWWNRGIAEEVTMASYSKAVTGTAVMARSANGEKKKKSLRAHLHAPPATIIPAEDDDELLDATPDIDVPVSTAVSSALTHLEQAIDDMHSASPKPLSFDPLFYLALSSLPLTYPWPILTIDLKNFLPLMDRTRPYALSGGSGLGQPEIPTPCPCCDLAFVI